MADSKSDKGAKSGKSDKAAKTPFAQPGALGMRLAELAQEEGLIIRAIGDVIAFCPPLIISAGEVDQMFDRFARARRIDSRRDLGDFSRVHSHIPRSVDIIPRIDDVAALQEQVVLRESRRKEEDRR